MTFVCTVVGTQVLIVPVHFDHILVFDCLQYGQTILTRFICLFLFLFVFIMKVKCNQRTKKKGGLRMRQNV